MRSIALACSISHFLLSATVEAENLKPIGRSPSFEVATALEVGVLKLVGYESLSTLEARSVEVDGVVTPQVTEVLSHVPVTTYLSYDDVEIRRASGEILARESAVKALANPTRVVVFRGAFDPYFAELLRSETIVFALRDKPLDARRPSLPTPLAPSTYGDKVQQQVPANSPSQSAPASVPTFGRP